MPPTLFKITRWGLLITLTGTVLCALLMGLPKPFGHWFREIHPMFGFTFVFFACLHIFGHRSSFFPKKPAPAKTPQENS